MSSNLFVIESRIADFSTSDQSAQGLQETVLTHGLSLGIGVLALALALSFAGMVFFSGRRE